MEKIVMLGVSIGTTGVALAILTYIKHMRGRAKRFLLRSERIKGFNQ